MPSAEIVVTVHLHRDDETVAVTVTDAMSGEQRTEEYTEAGVVMSIYGLMDMLVSVMENAEA